MAYGDYQDYGQYLNPDPWTNKQEQEPQQEYQTPGFAPSADPSTVTPPPTAPQPKFNLEGAMLHGRKANTSDFVDLMSLVQRQPGFDISTNEAAQATFKNIVQPLLAQQGINATLGGTNFDKITAGGKTIDWIGNSGSTTQARNAQALQGSDRSSVSGTPSPSATIYNPSMAGAPSSGAPSSGAPAVGGVTVATPPAGAVDPFAAMGGGVYLSNGSWVPKDHPAAIAAMNNGPAKAPVATGGTSAADPKSALIAQLMQRMQQGLEIDPNDPVIRNQTDAYSAQAERVRRNYLGDAAEGSSPFATGSLRNEERMTAERMGQDVGSFEATLMGRELTARRDEIQHAIDSMAGILTAQEKLALEKELGYLNASIERHKVDSQSAQFYAGLSSDEKKYFAGLSQQERLALMDNAFRNKQLGQQQGQFDDELGFKYSDRQKYWDYTDRNGVTP